MRAHTQNPRNLNNNNQGMWAFSHLQVLRTQFPLTAVFIGRLPGSEQQRTGPWGVAENGEDMIPYCEEFRC